ncbi:hypothetical protein NC652_032775 [Populus alba x Populus x berolinensis]|nr:hypothetical protein NC652_032775 [Populus alba x Populus x berolinensis]
MALDFENQNLGKEIDISAFGEGVWSNITATPPDFGNQNPCKKTDMSTPEEEQTLVLLDHPPVLLPLLVSVLGRVMDDYFSSVLPILPLLMEKGFKFKPTNEELISKYLVPKTRGDIMGGLHMAVVNLCEHEPWDLPGNNNIITS